MMVLDMPQGSPDWFAARIGSIGGSSIASVMAKGQGKSRKTLLYRLAGEMLSGEKYEGFTNEHMQRGVEQEADGRALYSFITGFEVGQVGLFKHSDHKHCSPDGVVGDDGLIEIKSVIPSTHVCTIDEGRIPAEYRKQIQWNLFISERQWCDFVSFSPLVADRPIWIERAKRDEKLIKEMDAEADAFIEELLALVEKIRGGE